MRIFVLAAVLPAVLLGEDPREIVRRSIELDRKNLEISRSYTYLQREEENHLDDAGRVKQREIRTWDVTLLEGSPYKRLVARDDRPLTAKEQQQEEEKLRRSNEERRKETPEQKARRIAEWEKNQQKRREPLRELPDAFDFHLAGKEAINGGEAWIIDATPKPGYKPKLSSASILPKLKLRIWVDSRDFQWARVEIETLDTVSFGGLLFRLAKGSHLLLEQARINDEVWLPKRVDVQISGKILLLRGYRRHIVTSFSDYKKFQVESRVVE